MYKCRAKHRNAESVTFSHCKTTRLIITLFQLVSISFVPFQQHPFYFNWPEVSLILNFLPASYISIRTNYSPRLARLMLSGNSVIVTYHHIDFHSPNNLSDSRSCTILWCLCSWHHRGTCWPDIGSQLIIQKGRIRWYLKAECGKVKDQFNYLVSAGLVSGFFAGMLIKRKESNFRVLEISKLLISFPKSYQVKVWVPQFLASDYFNVPIPFSSSCQFYCFHDGVSF